MDKKSKGGVHPWWTKDPAASAVADDPGATSESPPPKKSKWDVVSGGKFLLLSVFDGIGCIHLALEGIKAAPVASMAYEIDEECITLTKSRFPAIEHKGDAMKMKSKDILEWCTTHDASGLLPLLVAAGPPCPDFSRVKANPEGLDGEEGRKFAHLAGCINQMKKTTTRPIVLFIECVVPNVPKTATVLQELMSAKSVIMADSSDFGCIRRPRLFWSDVDWSKSDVQLQKVNGWDKIKITGPKDDWGKMISDDLQPSDELKNHRHLLPCFTTPCPDDAGRPKPKKDKQRDPETVARWKTDKQRFAPWCYEKSNMLTKKNQDGTTVLVVPPVPVKENLMHLPPGHTSCGNQARSQRKKETMIANSWHVGVVSFILKILLFQCIGISTSTPREHDRPSTFVDLPGQRIEGTRLSRRPDATSTYPPPWQDFTETDNYHGHDVPDVWQTVPTRICLRPVVLAANKYLVTKPLWTKPAAARVPLIPDAPDWRSHVRSALGLLHPSDVAPPMPPLLQWSLDSCWKRGPDVGYWRMSVIDDITSMAEEFRDEQLEWQATLPPHVRKAYGLPEVANLDGDTTATTIHVPLLLELLRLVEFPQIHEFRQELTQGFKVLGQLNPGVGWPTRTDSRYSSPISIDEYVAKNTSYVESLQGRKTDDKYEKGLVAEILEEINLGRMDGPHSTPSSWKINVSDAGTGRPLTAPPPGPHAAALAFPIVQGDKVRRGEDWRRSFGNSTVAVTDAPIHYDVLDFVNMGRTWRSKLHCHLAPSPPPTPARRAPEVRCDSEAEARETNRLWSAAGDGIHIWCQDHDGAYRQLPLESPGLAMMILPTSTGLSLWSHRVLMFGATGAVWGYNRTADILSNLSMILLNIVMGHYVDDFTGVEPSASSDSACESFEKLNEIIGTKMKAKKKQSPAPQHPLLGVNISFDEVGAVLSPKASRVVNISKMITDALGKSRLSPHEAAELTGKLVFLHSTVSGKVGRAAVKPIYACMNENRTRNHLPHWLSTALTTVLWLTNHSPPRRLEWWGTERPTLTIYADAFFDWKGVRYTAAELANDTELEVKLEKDQSNGWGVLIFPPPPARPLAFRSETPYQVLAAYGKRRAFIYFLESFAQVAAVAFAAHMGIPRITCYIDNEAARCALTKGYGRDDAVNSMISMFWATVTRFRIDVWFERVPTDLNPSDEISRDKWEVVAEIDAEVLHFDMKPVYDEMIKCSGDLDYAMQEASKKIPDYLWEQFLILKKTQ